MYSLKVPSSQTTPEFLFASPATATPAETASATIAIETLFIILRDLYSA